MRMMFSAGFALVVAGVLLLYVSTSKDAEFSRIQISQELGNEMESLLPAISEWAVIGDYANIEQTLKQRAKHDEIDRVAWTDRKGRIVEAINSLESPQAPGWFIRWVNIPDQQATRALNIGGRDYGSVTLVTSASVNIDHMWATFLSHLNILVLAVALDFIGILLILKHSLRPLSALEKGAGALADGDMATRIPLQGSPELTHIMAAFNRMAQAVETAQADLRQEAERLSVTLSSIGDGVIAADNESRVSFMNPIAEELTGWKADEARGRPLLEIFRIANEFTRLEVECPTARALRDGVIVGLANHTLLLARDGREIPIADSAAPIRHADGRIGGAVLVFRDQTEEHETLERLALAAGVFEHAIESIVVTDAERVIIEVNPAFSQITGYCRNEVLGQTPRLLASGMHEPAFYESMWKDIQIKGHWNGEIWNRRKNGDIYPERLSIVAVRDTAGKINRYIGIFTDVSELKAQEARLEHMAHYDPLTGLPNRALLTDRMKVALAQAMRSGEKLAICYLDLDGFKPINDTHGHAMGDRLLAEVATRLNAAVRGGDTVARLGGDEFVLLLAGLADVEECEGTLTRVLHAVSQPVPVDGERLLVTASIGATIFPGDGSDSDTLMRHADQAMYAAKEAGRNRYHLFDPQHDHTVRRRRELLNRIETALQQEEFRLYYQPKVDMCAGTVIGAEALIRWRHPERGMLLPGEFLPMLEDAELEIRIGEWVITEALRQMAAWRATGLDLRVSVNVAAHHLASINFAERMKLMLDSQPSVAKHRLELEVLESAAIEDVAHVSSLIKSCQRIGVSFALDDFGTGYSSLTYLKRLPAETLKIDQSFVCDMLTDVEDMAIIEGVIGLAEAFHRSVIAEGVETAAHGRMLLHLGCFLGQGYGIARPMPADELPAWIAAWQPDPSWKSV